MMKIGYTIWTWLRNAMNDWEHYGPYAKRDFEQALREISDLGYTVFENFNIQVKIHEDNPQEFDELCQKYNVKFVNIYHYLTKDFDADMKLAERCLKFVTAHGAKLMNIEAPWWPHFPEVYKPTEKDLAEVSDKLAKMGKLARDYGVTLCLHPHYGTLLCYEHEIDYVMERVDPDLLSLTIDTAHTTLAKMDPAAALAKYYPRTKYIHIKDWDPTVDQVNPMKGFCALGEGIVALKPAFLLLKGKGYDGILTVECDYPRICNYETAKVSREYIHRVFGM